MFEIGLQAPIRLDSRGIRGRPVFANLFVLTATSENRVKFFDLLMPNSGDTHMLIQQRNFSQKSGATGGSEMRILIADDHELLRDTLVLFLESEGGIETVTAPDLASAEELVANDSFDLVLLDYSMPGMNGLAGLERIMGMDGGQRVAIISGTAKREVAEEVLASGAAGFLPKTLSAKSLINAVRFMAMGEQYAPLDFLRAAENEPEHPLAKSLSQREFEVLQGLTEGKSNKEIARDLDIREPTVKLHVKTLYRKIGASNRTQAAMIARDKGLF